MALFERGLSMESHADFKVRKMPDGKQIDVVTDINAYAGRLVGQEWDKLHPKPTPAPTARRPLSQRFGSFVKTLVTNNVRG
jgi:hypothetical protein